MGLTCKFCKGQGHIKQRKANNQYTTILCPHCRGKNKPEKPINYNACMYCGGTGWIVGCCGEKTIRCEACQNNGEVLS